MMHTLNLFVFSIFLLQSGKLKGMMPTIISIGERLRGKISIAAKENKSIEIKDLAIRFVELHTINFIGIGSQYQIENHFPLDLLWMLWALLLSDWMLIHLKIQMIHFVIWKNW